MKLSSKLCSLIAFVATSPGRRFGFANAAFTTHSSFSEIISKYDGLILDQFGVLHNGVEAMDGAVDCLKELHRRGKALIILSNTSAPSEAALQKLPKFGFDRSLLAGAVTSGEEASKYIKRTFGSSETPSKLLFITWDASDPSNPRLTATPTRFLQECGNVQVSSSVEEADFLLFHGSEVWYRGEADQDSLSPFIETGNMVNLEPIMRQCVARDLPAVCANPDFIVQTPSGGKAYMPGRLAARYEELGGSCTTFGKPQAEHFLACIEKLGLDKSRVAHVGDSLHHDITGAFEAGIPSIFITSGIHASELQTSFGEMPDATLLGQVIDRHAARSPPTHVIPAFRI